MASVLDESDIGDEDAVDEAQGTPGSGWLVQSGIADQQWQWAKRRLTQWGTPWRVEESLRTDLNATRKRDLGEAIKGRHSDESTCWFLCKEFGDEDDDSRAVMVIRAELDLSREGWIGYKLTQGEASHHNDCPGELLATKHYPKWQLARLSGEEKAWRKQCLRNNPGQPKPGEYVATQSGGTGEETWVYQVAKGYEGDPRELTLMHASGLPMHLDGTGSDSYKAWLARKDWWPASAQQIADYELRKGALDFIRATDVKVQDSLAARAYEAAMVGDKWQAPRLLRELEALREGVEAAGGNFDAIRGNLRVREWAGEAMTGQAQTHIGPGYQPSSLMAREGQRTQADMQALHRGDPCQEVKELVALWDQATVKPEDKLLLVRAKQLRARLEAQAEWVAAQSERAKTQIATLREFLGRAVDWEELGLDAPGVETAEVTVA